MKSYLLLAFNNLKRRKLRAWLTILGIFIGIAAVVSLISLGQGLQGFIDDQFQQLGANKIIVQPKTIGPPGSASGEDLVLNERDLEAIRDLPGVEDAEGALSKTGIIQNDDQQEVVLVNGVNERYLDVFGEIDALDTIEGRQLRDGDSSKAVVGYNHMFGNLWEKPIRIGDDIEIRGKRFDVVGVLKSQGNSFDDNSVWIQKDVFTDLFETGNDQGVIVVQTQENLDPEKIAEDIREELRDLKNQEEGQETFTVQTSAQLLETFTNIFSVVQAILIGIAAISLLVGGIGIMNTMYTSVLERTKEIGTMKAVGAKNSDILWIFLFESGLLGLVGGTIGIALGIGIGKTVEYIATVQLGTPFLRAIFGWQLILGALAFSFIIGTLSGILPAMQAAKLRPAEALRHE